MILRHDELKKAEKKIERLWTFKKDWTEHDKQSFDKLKARRKTLMEILKMEA